MINCLHPITLKSGLTVGCGKCLLCLSKRRDEWSHRLQLHSYGYDRMPLFVGLTYDDASLNWGGNRPSLYRRDPQLFIKKLKENFNLYNTNFSYFGCGEYGDKYDRPHYHFLFFGFDELQDHFERDFIGSHEVLRKVWSFGNVDIGVAQWSGVHYVTKYVLKYDEENYEDVQKPFIIASHGLGLPWLETPDAKYLKRRLLDAFRSHPLPSLRDIDVTDIHAVNDVYQDLRRYYPKLVAHTPQGFEVPLPRYLRDKMIGHFEVWSDNPFWMVNELRSQIDMLKYRDWLEYDKESAITYRDQVLDQKIRRIKQRVYLNKKDFKNETIRIGSYQETCL